MQFLLDSTCLTRPFSNILDEMGSLVQISFFFGIPQLVITGSISTRAVVWAVLFWVRIGLLHFISGLTVTQQH